MKYVYIFGKSLLVLGFLFPSSSVFSPPPSKKLTPKEKGEHRRELYDSPEEKIIILLFFIDAPTRARERETPHPTKRERERERKRGRLSQKRLVAKIQARVRRTEGEKERG